MTGSEVADRLFPKLATPDDSPALQVGDRALTYRELAVVSGRVAAALRGHHRVAVWATPTIETCVAVVGALLAGVPVVPVNPKIGSGDLAHIVNDSAPELVCIAPDDALPPELDALPTLGVDVTATAGDLPEPLPEPSGETPALVVYTSGTTGRPKGVVLPRRAIASNLDALAVAWEWTAQDVLVHALPLFHVHGLILGIVAPLRRGAAVWHLGRFTPDGVGAALRAGGTMMFGVPTMYHRLIDAAEHDPLLVQALARARLLVSGSAALPAVAHVRIAELIGQRIVERYGMTETLMNCAVRADGDRRPGVVGPPVDGVELRLVDESGATIEGGDDSTVGEILVRGPNLFLEYLNRPDATAEAMRDGWFHTGDLAVRAPDGYLRIVGRRATDLIKSGGYKIGAGEVENALLEHPAVAEAAVTAEPDPDLGERIVAWIVPAEGKAATADELADHVARLLAPYKRPRRVVFRESLPRNEMGKVRKTVLIAESAE